MIGAIMAALVAISIPLVIRVILGLGIGFVTYTGADYALSTAETFINSKLAGLPADMLQILYLAGFDEGIKIIFAAWAANITIGVTMGAFTRFKFSGV